MSLVNINDVIAADQTKKCTDMAKGLLILATYPGVRAVMNGGILRSHVDPELVLEEHEKELLELGWGISPDEGEWCFPDQTADPDVHHDDEPWDEDPCEEEGY